MRPDSGESSAPPRGLRGVCRVQFAFDVGQSIQMAKMRELVLGTASGGARPMTHMGDRPESICFREAGDPVAVGAARTEGAVEVEMYEFGAVSMTYRLPLPDDGDRWLDLSCELAGNAALRKDARRRVDAILDRVRAAVVKPGVSDVVEDYIVFHVAEWDAPLDASAWIALHRARLAQILRADREPLSAEEIEDAHSCRISYGERDAALLDWSTALVLDPHAADVFWLIEFANVQLMELRLLESALDSALERSYEEMSRRLGGGGWIGRIPSRARWRIAQLQLDGAIQFGLVTNSLKLTGEQYLARVYRGLSQRFQLEPFDRSIARKLDTLESVFEKLSDRAATLRMELLEWIIIILFVVSIAISLRTGH